MTVDQLTSIRLTHLMSGIDEDRPHAGADAAMATDITGYTEWVSDTSPAVTLGWDWQMLAADSRSTLRRLAGVRTNVMLQNGKQFDLGQTQTEVVLERYIDDMDWQSAALRHLGQRYRAG